MVVKVTKLHVQNWTGDGMEVGWKTGRGGGREGGISALTSE